MSGEIKTIRQALQAKARWWMPKTTAAAAAVGSARMRPSAIVP